MALYHRLRVFKRGSILNFNFSTSCPCTYRWLEDKGLESNPRQDGPLTNLPDYSFVDGRPVPLSNNKLRKTLQQQELCKRIVELTQEIDVGLENYNQRVKEEEERRQAIIQNKLKPKGNLLLQHKKISTSKS